MLIDTNNFNFLRDLIRCHVSYRPTYKVLILTNFKTDSIQIVNSVAILIPENENVYLSSSEVTQARKLLNTHNVSFNIGFIHFCFNQTYSIDGQVVDSAASANAMFFGVKTKSETLGVAETVTHLQCNTTAANKLELNIMDESILAGMGVRSF